MIQEDYVTLEQAKLLKEKGFPQDTSLSKYGVSLWGGNRIENLNIYPCKQEDLVCIVPTLSLAQKWLREEKSIWIDVFCDTRDCENSVWDTVYYYRYTFGKNSQIVGNLGDFGPFDTYEEALSVGISKALELI